MLENKSPVMDPVYAFHTCYLPGQEPVYFSAHASGLYISRNRESRWENAYQSLLGDAVLPTLALAGAPLADRSWMVLAGVPGAVLRSQDGGQSWKVARLPEPEPVVTALAVSPNFAEDGTAYAATEEDGVFVTTNHGASWASWNFGLIDMHAFALAVSPAFSSDQQVFVGVSSGLFRSQNRGHSWQPIELPCGYDAVLSLALSPGFAQDGMGFAGTENYGLLQTVDGGLTWHSIGSQTIQGSVNGLALDPAFPVKPSLAALVEAGIYISGDRGQNWEPWVIESLPEAFEITAFATPEGLAPGSPVWLGGSDGKVYLVSYP